MPDTLKLLLETLAAEWVEAMEQVETRFGRHQAFFGR